MDLEQASRSELIAEIARLQAQVGVSNLPDTWSELQSQQLVQDIINVSPLAIYAKNVYGHYVLVNEEAASNIGAPVATVLGKTNYDFYPQDIADELRRIDTMIINTRQGLEREVSVQIGDFFKTFLSIRTPLFDATGNIYAIAGIATDITARKQAEERLIQSEQLYRLLFESNPLPLLMYDVETAGFLAVNDAAVQLYGYSRNEFLHLSMYDILPESYHAAISKRMQIARDRITQGIHTGFFAQSVAEFVNRRKDGSVFPLETYGQGIIYEGRAAFFLVIHDLTARKHAEAAMHASEARYQALSEATFEGLILHEAGTIVAVNHVVTHMLGYAAAELVGNTYNVFVNSNDRALLDHHFGSDSTDTFFLTVVRKDGSSFPIEAQSKPILYGDKHVKVMAIRDISRRRAMEESLRISQQQLMQSQRIEAIGLLAGGIAHDFNNLLTVITGYGSLLQDAVNNTSMLDDVKEIMAAANRASELTRQLLAYSRRQVLRPSVLNLNEIVDTMERMLGRLIGEDISLTVSTDPNIQSVLVDRSQFEQVLMNLVVNSRDAMPYGGTLTIETAMVTLDETYHTDAMGTVKNGHYVMLAISDTGVGIDQEMQARIFDPFFTTKAVGKGTGLGLSTVYGIVKQSEGYIWVYSEPQHGTTFKIYLPAVEAIDEPALNPTSATPNVAAEPSSPAPVLTGKETILVVEDETTVQVLVQRVLQAHGYQVVLASSALFALEIVSTQQSEIDLVLTDMVMPHMSGIDLIRRLHVQAPTLRTVCMSGYTDRIAKERHGLTSCQHFLQKPFTPEALLRIIRTALDTMT